MPNTPKTKLTLTILSLCIFFTCSIKGQVKDSIITPDQLKDIKFIKPKFSANFGTYISNNSSGLTIGSKQLGLGVVINLEDALGLETNTTVLRGGVEYNFGKRLQHGLSLDYFRINRSSLKTLADDIEIGDYIFSIGDNIKTEFNLSIIKLKYNYAFLSDERVDVAFSCGFFIIPMSFEISSDQFDSQKGNFIAPLPVLGISSNFLLAKNLYLKQSADLLYLKVNNLKGSIVDLNLAIEHAPFKHFRYGLGVNTFKINIYANQKESDINFFGNVNMDYSGVMFYLKYCL